MKNIQFKFLTNICIYSLYYNKIGKVYYQVICTDDVRPNEILFIALVYHTKEQSNVFKYYDTGMNMISIGIDFNKIIIEALDKISGYN